MKIQWKNWIFLYFLGKFVAIDRNFGNNIIFIQQFFPVRGGGFKPTPPLRTPLNAEEEHTDLNNFGAGAIIRNLYRGQGNKFFKENLESNAKSTANVQLVNRFKSKLAFTFLITAWHFILLTLRPLKSIQCVISNRTLKKRILLKLRNNCLSVIKNSQLLPRFKMYYLITLALTR